MFARIFKGCLSLIIVLLVLGCAGVGIAYVQGKRTPKGPNSYVALGSSFAAGAGLGSLQDGSPYPCARSVGGYPQHLARQLDVPIMDMTCGGATTKHVLNGGQFFQGPQVRTIGQDTRLVTITVGGNDVGYVGDLSMLAARNSDSAFGWLVRHFWNGPAQDRDFEGLRKDLLQTLRAIHGQAPKARIVVATYPTILPPSGTCDRIGLTTAEAGMMRGVAEQLAATTRSAAEEGKALVVDMHVLGAAHNACSKSPWTRGWVNGGIAPFHPTEEGAQATAEAIMAALRRSPAAIAAIRQDDAAGHQAGRVGRKK